MESISDSTKAHLAKTCNKDESTSDDAGSEKEATDQGLSRYVDLFPRVWRKSTMDNNLSLHGFRRFKTSHLLNIRFLEEEIAEIDHEIYQAGLSLELEPTPADRLGLKTSKRDANVPKIEDTINSSLILRLRSVLKDYDEALGAFNRIMNMETFSLADDGYQSSERNDLSPQEICNTRLVRVDLGPRSTQDPFQRQLHKFFRTARIRSLLKKNSYDEEANSTSICKLDISKSVQDSILIAGVIGRFLVAILTAAFLIIPLVISAYQKSKGAQLCTIGISVLIFAFLVSFSMRTTNHEIMAISSAYAAVLSVIVSNGFV